MSTNQGSYAGHDYDAFDFRDEYESQEWEFRRDAAGYEPRNTRYALRRRLRGGASFVSAGALAPAGTSFVILPLSAIFPARAMRGRRYGARSKIDCDRPACRHRP